MIQILKTTKLASLSAPSTSLLKQRRIRSQTRIPICPRPGKRSSGEPNLKETSPMRLKTRRMTLPTTRDQQHRKVSQANKKRFLISFSRNQLQLLRSEKRSSGRTWWRLKTKKSSKSAMARSTWRRPRKRRVKRFRKREKRKRQLCMA